MQNTALQSFIRNKQFLVFFKYQNMLSVIKRFVYL